MDLKQYKYINNTKQLPGFANGFVDPGNAFANKYAPAQGFANADFAKNAISNNLKTNSLSSRWNNSKDDLLAGTATALGGFGTLSSNRTPITPASGYVGKNGVTQNYIDGIGYQTYRDVDTAENRQVISDQASAQKKQNALTGSSIGATAGTALATGIGAMAGAGAATLSWLGPAGAAAGLLLGGLGGLLFGGDDEEEQLRQLAIAQTKENNYNEKYRSDALTAALQKRQSDQYGDTSSQMLYSAKYGNEGVNPATNETYKNFLVQTSHGPKIDKQNAWLDDGEWVESVDGSAYQVSDVSKIKNKKSKLPGFSTGSSENKNSSSTDNVRARIEPGDRIAASHVYLPGTRISMADLYPIARAQGQTDELFDMQANIKQGMKQKQHGLPEYAIGWENLISTVPGFIASWNDYRNIKNDEIKETNLTPYNKYEAYARNLLANRRANMNPVYQNILQNDAQSRYRINASSGLSAGQKMLANIANAANTRRVLGNAILQGQEMDNKYIGEEAQYMGSLGNQIMNAGLEADKFNVQMNNAAHNSKIQGLNMARRNMLDYLTQFGKNAWENDVFSKLYKLYAQDVAEKERGVKEKAKEQPKKKNNLYTGSLSPGYIYGPYKQNTKIPGWPIPVEPDNRWPWIA